MKIPLVRKATGNHLVISNSLEKLRALFLLSHTLQIKYATELYENTIGEEGNGKPPRQIQFPRKTQSPFSAFSYARNRVCNPVYSVSESIVSQGVYTKSSAKLSIRSFLASFLFASNLVVLSRDSLWH